jgi:histidine triad (HIT) family protein
MAKGQVAAEKVFEDDDVFVIKDINAQAPVHLLIITKEHFADILEISERSPQLAVNIQQAITIMAERFALKKNGFRIVANTGQQGGQTVPHLHFHLLGGRDMGWPPG